MRAILVSLVCLAIGGVLAFGYRYWESKGERELASQLHGCAETRSFDNTKWLYLFADHGAQLVEAVGEPDEHRFTGFPGTWHYDEATKRYAVTVKGDTTLYAMFDPDDFRGCILFKGAPDQAKLLESWFATVGDEPDDYYDESHGEPH
jgi:hypothetical protein